jgi:regulatory protein
MTLGMSTLETGSTDDGDPDYLTAKNAALRFLATRARSEAEVRRRLERRYAALVIDRVVATLNQQGYLNDAAFAQQWRAHRERLRPRGKGLLRQELLRLGVSAETINEALQDFDAVSNAYQAGRNLAVRLSRTGYANFRQRLWSHLQRRGFESIAIEETVQTLWRELADPFDGDEDAHGDEQ